MTAYDYIHDGNAIYERSFAIIRAEADLARFSPEEADVAVRMIHAAGLVGLERNIRFSPGFVTVARAALEAGAPIFCARSIDPVSLATGRTRSSTPSWLVTRKPARCCSFACIRICLKNFKAAARKTCMS